MAELSGSTETADEISQGSLTADTDLSALLTAILGDAADVTDFHSDLGNTLQGIVADSHDATVEETTHVAALHIDLEAAAATPLGTSDLLVGPLKDDLATVTSTPPAVGTTVDLEVGRQLDEVLRATVAADLASMTAAQVQVSGNGRSTPAETRTLAGKQGARQRNRQKRTKGAWVVTAPAPAPGAVDTSASPRHNTNASVNHAGGAMASMRGDRGDTRPAARKEQRSDVGYQQSPGEPDLNAVDGRLVYSVQASHTAPPVMRRDELFAGNDVAAPESAARSWRERLPLLMVAGVVVVALLVWLAMRQAA